MVVVVGLAVAHSERRGVGDPFNMDTRVSSRFTARRLHVHKKGRMDVCPRTGARTSPPHQCVRTCVEWCGVEEGRSRGKPSPTLVPHPPLPRGEGASEERRSSGGAPQ